MGIKIEVISRGDSTLRGHFPGESDSLADSLGYKSPPYLIIPFFLEGGRYTLDDIQYVAEGEMLVPAAETSYAQDLAFGYKHSNLREWVDEKTDGHIPVDRIASVSLTILRQGNIDQVVNILTSLKPGSACVVNAASYRDLEVFVLGLIEAEEQGCVFLPRAASSFVRVRAGVGPRPLLQCSDLTVHSSRGGLFIVGSHVPKTTEQLDMLMARTSIERAEIQVENLLDDSAQNKEIQSIIQTVDEYIEGGKDLVIYTSRKLAKGNDIQSSIAIGQRVSDSLVRIVRGIHSIPRYLVTKGGATSSDLATRALNVRRAMVMGQVLPGVPAWKLDLESRFPGVPYILFPGNVGDADALVQIHRLLSQKVC
jgi:uncharacterized protein YgbK (DUF1537 family)